MPTLDTPAQSQAVSERIQQVKQRLTNELQAQFSPQDIDAAADEFLAAYQTAPVMDFLPLFVERFTRERLLARLQGQAQA
jgi:hypothetical protein